MTHDLKKEDFEYFTKAVRFYVEKLNLNHLKFYTIFDDDMEDDDSAAEAYHSYTGASVWITLNSSGIENISGNKKADIDRIARHEVIESGIIGAIISLTLNKVDPKTADSIRRESHVAHNIIDGLITERFYKEGE